MSILIKGMEMPKSCYECRFAFDGMCIANRGRKDVGITNSCPLIELPPHGRLIDADAIPYKKIMLDEDDGEFYYGVTQPYIDRMPTIIEAEEGGNEDAE